MLLLIQLNITLFLKRVDWALSCPSVSSTMLLCGKALEGDSFDTMHIAHELVIGPVDGFSARALGAAVLSRRCALISSTKRWLPWARGCEWRTRLWVVGIAAATIIVLVVGVSRSLSSVAVVLECFDSKQFAEQWPPAHEIGDIDCCAGFTDVPDLVCGCERGGKIEIFV